MSKTLKRLLRPALVLGILILVFAANALSQKPRNPDDLLAWARQHGIAESVYLNWANSGVDENSVISAIQGANPNPDAIRASCRGLPTLADALVAAFASSSPAPSPAALTPPLLPPATRLAPPSTATLPAIIAAEGRAAAAAATAATAAQDAAAAAGRAAIAKEQATNTADPTVAQNAVRAANTARDEATAASQRAQAALQDANREAGQSATAQASATAAQQSARNAQDSVNAAQRSAQEAQAALGGLQTRLQQQQTQQAATAAAAAARVLVERPRGDNDAPPPLENLGATCYANATLQAVMSLARVRALFNTPTLQVNFKPFFTKYAPQGGAAIAIDQALQAQITQNEFALARPTLEQTIFPQVNAAFGPYTYLGRPRDRFVPRTQEEDAPEFLTPLLKWINNSTGYQLYPQLAGNPDLSALAGYADPLFTVIDRLGPQIVSANFLFDAIATTRRNYRQASADTANFVQLTRSDDAACFYNMVPRPKKLYDAFLLLEMPADYQNRPLLDFITYYLREDRSMIAGSHCDEDPVYHVTEHPIYTQIIMRSAPQILGVQLKRFHEARHGVYVKNTTNVAIPIINDLEIPLQNRQIAHFKCRSIVFQSGDMARGHYFAVVKKDNPSGRATDPATFYMCNDGGISTVSAADLTTIEQTGALGDATAYLIFYEWTATTPAPPLPPRTTAAATTTTAATGTGGGTPPPLPAPLLPPPPPVSTTPKHDELVDKVRTLWFEDKGVSDLGDVQGQSKLALVLSLVPAAEADCERILQLIGANPNFSALLANKSPADQAKPPSKLEMLMSRANILVFLQQNTNAAQLFAQFFIPRILKQLGLDDQNQNPTQTQFENIITAMIALIEALENNVRDANFCGDLLVYLQTTFPSPARAAAPPLTPAAVVQAIQVFIAVPTTAAARAALPYIWRSQQETDTASSPDTKLKARVFRLWRLNYPLQILGIPTEGSIDDLLLLLKNLLPRNFNIGDILADAAWDEELLKSGKQAKDHEFKPQSPLGIIKVRFFVWERFYKNPGSNLRDLADVFNACGLSYEKVKTIRADATIKEPFNRMMSLSKRLAPVANDAAFIRTLQGKVARLADASQLLFTVAKEVVFQILSQCTNNVTPDSIATGFRVLVGWSGMQLQALIEAAITWPEYTSPTKFADVGALTAKINDWITTTYNPAHLTAKIALLAAPAPLPAPATGTGGAPDLAALAAERRARGLLLSPTGLGTGTGTGTGAAPTQLPLLLTPPLPFTAPPPARVAPIAAPAPPATLPLLKQYITTALNNIPNQEVFADLFDAPAQDPAQLTTMFEYVWMLCGNAAPTRHLGTNQQNLLIMTLIPFLPLSSAGPCFDYLQSQEFFSTRLCLMLRDLKDAGIAITDAATWQNIETTHPEWFDDRQHPTWQALKAALLPAAPPPAAGRRAPAPLAQLQTPLKLRAITNTGSKCWLISSVQALFALTSFIDELIKQEPTFNDANDPGKRIRTFITLAQSFRNNEAQATFQQKFENFAATIQAKYFGGGAITEQDAVAFLGNLLGVDLGDERFGEGFITYLRSKCGDLPAIMTASTVDIHRADFQNNYDWSGVCQVGDANSGHWTIVACYNGEAYSFNDGGKPKKLDGQPQPLSQAELNNIAAIIAEQNAAITALGLATPAERSRQQALHPLNSYVFEEHNRYMRQAEGAQRAVDVIKNQFVFRDGSGYRVSALYCVGKDRSAPVRAIDQDQNVIDSDLTIAAAQRAAIEQAQRDLQGAAPTFWACPTCTLHNALDKAACDACGDANPHPQSGPAPAASGRQQLPEDAAVTTAEAELTRRREQLRVAERQLQDALAEAQRQASRPAGGMPTNPDQLEAWAKSHGITEGQYLDWVNNKGGDENLVINHLQRRNASAIRTACSGLPALAEALIRTFLATPSTQPSEPPAVTEARRTLATAQHAVTAQENIVRQRQQTAAVAHQRAEQAAAAARQRAADALTGKQPQPLPRPQGLGAGGAPAGGSGTGGVLDFHPEDPPSFEDSTGCQAITQLVDAAVRNIQPYVDAVNAMALGCSTGGIDGFPPTENFSIYTLSQDIVAAKFTIPPTTVLNANQSKALKLLYYLEWIKKITEKSQPLIEQMNKVLVSEIDYFANLFFRENDRILRLDQPSEQAKKVHQQRVMENENKKFVELLKQRKKSLEAIAQNKIRLAMLAYKEAYQNIADAPLRISINTSQLKNLERIATEPIDGKKLPEIISEIANSAFESGTLSLPQVPTLKFRDTVAIDAGGPRRTFFTEYFNNFFIEHNVMDQRSSRTIRHGTIFRNNNSSSCKRWLPAMPDASDANQYVNDRLLVSLGQLMLIALVQQEPFACPFGPQFFKQLVGGAFDLNSNYYEDYAALIDYYYDLGENSNIYTILISLNYEPVEALGDPQKPYDRTKYSVYLQNFDKNQAYVTEKIKDLKNDGNELKAAKHIRDGFRFYFDMTDGIQLPNKDNILTDLTATQNYICKLVAEITKALTPYDLLFWIGKAEIDPELLKTKINVELRDGISDTENIVQAVKTAIKDVVEEHKEDQEFLRNFVKTFSGATVLKDELRIDIKSFATKRPDVVQEEHTCFNAVDLKYSYLVDLKKQSRTALRDFFNDSFVGAGVFTAS